MRGKLFCFFTAALVLINAAHAYAKKKDVRNDPIVPKTKKPTYCEQVVKVFEQIFPESGELTYGGVSVGVKRKNVICERCERDGNSFWITCRAKYVGTIGAGPLKKEVGADRVRISYENGHVSIDVGGAKGIINTKSVSKEAEKLLGAAIKKWIKGRV